MSAAFRESLRVTPDVVFVLVQSDDGGGARVQAVYDHGPGEAPEVLTTLAIPSGSLTELAALLARAAERTAG